jgi:hypothetical protein
MGGTIRRTLSWAAIIAIAIQAVLGPLTLPSAQAANDPSSVICHSVTPDHAEAPAQAHRRNRAITASCAIRRPLRLVRISSRPPHRGL